MEQERAEFALSRIQAIVQENSTVQAEMRRYLNGLPALIHMNGLGQAMAFYRSQGKSSTHEKVYQILAAWLCNASSKGRIFTEDADLLTAITRSDMQHYMAAQNEAQALLEWLKKFALALLKKAQDD